MAQSAIQKHGISIRLACECLGISETCLRYQAKLSSENAEVAAPVNRSEQALGFWFVLSVPAQREGLWLEPQTRLSDLPRA